ncbi:Ankyrin repeat-containing protein [Oryctes borbonicus]|uniref:Ankyrin repeat-containing protein n=1 Tax=Oryctes borbonicus TaxID=1629725 RepID=A0A0T6BBS0_9SCAR|nr:Ankyrin repeat-containing protein [Oryctes borbonicus]
MAKQTPGSKCDTGSKYELSVTALFASHLSKNENVEDYRIFSNFCEAQPFDDIVAEVHFRGSDQKQLYAIQVKSGRDKLNLNKYWEGYDRIVGGRGLRLGENMRNDHINFWYFCSKSPTKNIISLTRHVDTIDFKFRPRSRPYNIHEAILDRGVCFELSSDDPKVIEHQHFLSRFYLFLNQPDTQRIVHIIKGMWNIDNPELIFLYLDNSFAKSTNSVDKAAFEHELLKNRFSDYVVTPTKAIVFKHKAVNEWNRLTLEKTVTIVRNAYNIEQYLFGCILQSISDIINIAEWNRAVDNAGKLDSEARNKFKTRCLKIETLKDLIVQTWIEGKAPLLLRVDSSLLLLKEFPHLKKSYVIIVSNVDKRYSEIKNYGLSAFTHLGDVVADEIMKSILVSLQGRKPVSLHAIINGDKMLMEAVTCLDIINLMKPRNAYLNPTCLEGTNYMLFIIESASPQSNNYGVLQPTGNNIAIYCESAESYEHYKKIRADTKFRSYNIFRLRLTDDNKLMPIPRVQEVDVARREEDNYSFGCHFIDENEESVFNTENSGPVPVIGEILVNICPKYVPRHLRKWNGKNLLSEDDSNHFETEYNGERFAEKDFLKESKGAIVVITGEPGMGKSTLLRSLYYLYGPRHYVAFIDLSHYQIDLHERNPKLFQDPLDFLCNKHGALPYNRLSRSIYDYHDRLVVLLDSFDEGLATCQDQLLELIQRFQEVGLQKIIIASRLSVVNLLIDKFEAETFKIEGFDDDSDQRYIDNWNLNISSLRHIPSEFRTNPLYLNMLRTISENEINLAVVNRWNLYESIVNLKMKDYCQRMKPHCLDENEKHNILSYHWQLALKTVFGNCTLRETVQQRKQLKYSNFTRLGFITCFDDSENPIFIHHTFAEFFVMQWLIENVDHDDAASVYMLMLKSKRHILDMYSENLPLHKAILHESAEKIKALCAENSECLSVTDDLGRSVLHLAALVCERDFFRKSNRLNTVLQCMRKNGCDLYIPDKILKWTWVDYWENYIFVRNLWRDEYIATLEEYLNYYATNIDKLKNSKFSCDKHFNKLYNIAISHSSISMIEDLLFLKYHEDEHFLEFRDMCLNSRLLRKKKVLNLKLQEENLKGVHLACIYSNVEAVRTYIEAGININKTDVFNCTPLHYGAFAKKSFEIVGLLLEKCKISNPHAGQSNDTTILHMAVRTGDANVTRMLLKTVDVNLMDKRHFTPLLAAIESANLNDTEVCHTNRFDLIEVLLKHQAEVNFIPCGKYTPLELAIMYGRKDIVEMLLEYQVDVNFSNWKHMRSLCKAIEMGNIEIIELLLRNGAEVNYMHLDDLTPLIYAIKVKDKDIIEMLIYYNADVNCRNRYDKTPLCRAIEENSIDIVELLLRNGANVNYVNLDSFTPLIIAIIKTKRNTVPISLDNNTYINFPGHITVSTSKKMQIIEVLLRNGADINYTDLNGMTPLTHAIKVRDIESIQILLKNNADVNFMDESGQTPLFKAIDTRSTDIIELLLLNGACVNHVDRLCRTPLIRAIALGNKDIIQLLLNYKANINLTNDDGQTPLYNAVEKQNVEILELLVKAKADLNCVDKFGFTPLMTAAEASNMKIAEALLENNANVNFKSECCITALYVAAFKRNVGMVELLLKYGADANTMILGGEFLQNAKRTGNIEIVLRLLKNSTPRDLLSAPSGSTDLNSAQIIIRNVVENWNDVDLEKELRTAVQEGILNFNSVKVLMGWGGKMKLADEFWIRTLCIVEEMNSEDTDDILIRNVFKCALEDRVTELCHAISEERNLDIIKILFRNGIDANSVNRETDLTLLQTAIEMNYRGFVEILLRNHADVNLAGDNDTPLCIAIRKQNDVIIKMLLKHGCDVNYIDKYGLTPLMIAVADENRAIAELLLTNNADVNHVGISGLTALYIAARTRNRYMVDMLFKHGAKEDIKTSGKKLLRYVRLMQTAGAINFPANKMIDHARFSNKFSYLFVFNKTERIIEKVACGCRNHL